MEFFKKHKKLLVPMLCANLFGLLLILFSYTEVSMSNVGELAAFLGVLFQVGGWLAIPLTPIVKHLQLRNAKKALKELEPQELTRIIELAQAQLDQIDSEQLTINSDGKQLAVNN